MKTYPGAGLLGSKPIREDISDHFYISTLSKSVIHPVPVIGGPVYELGLRLNYICLPDDVYLNASKILEQWTVLGGPGIGLPKDYIYNFLTNEARCLPR